jgi:ribosomal protein S12 methylthiotransferase accessory factor
MGPLGITRVANVTGLDCIGIPVVMVCRPNARSLSVSQGKGLDAESAKASGLLETVELYHAERISLPLKLASWNELRFTHSLVDVEKLPKLSIGQFHPNHTLLWIEGLNPVSGKSLWLPYELVHTNYTLPVPTGSGCFFMSSNGLASGNHPLEAVSHGLCEVVERDAGALFRCRPSEQQGELRVDPETIGDHDCQELLERFSRAGIEVGIWDITSDVGIPAFRCVVVEKTIHPFRQLGPLEGMGCHPVREIALLRALTEAAQGRLTLIAGSRDDNARAVYAAGQDRLIGQRARDCLAAEPRRHFEETPSYDNDSFEEDVALILARLSAAGMSEVVVVDLSKPEFGIPVVRVVVPGLESYHHASGCLPGERAIRVLEARNGEGPS